VYRSHEGFGREEATFLATQILILEDFITLAQERRSRQSQRIHSPQLGGGTIHGRRGGIDHDRRACHHLNSHNWYQGFSEGSVTTFKATRWARSQDSI
jgi:hypothetical protein